MADFLVTKAQEFIDRFYVEHGPCCAGCDWWRSLNSRAGECHKAAPVSGIERFAMIGIEKPSLQLEAGQIMTQREHHCGDFKDEFDWASLPPHYLRKIGWEASHG
jgi:hypothetical protein